MGKLYTKKGDEGFTTDYAGNILKKNDLLIKIAGKIDKLQSAVDTSILLSNEKNEILEIIQKKLWQASGEISNCPGECIVDPITNKDLQNLELFIDKLGEPPNKFVRFNTQKSISFNECRIRCRELETLLVELLLEKKLRSEIYKYVNRLSSLFFMLAYKES
jgi:cob(I)alamin adenosyltransferase